MRFGRGRASAESLEQGRKDKAREGAPDDQTSLGSSEFVRIHGGFRRGIRVAWWRFWFGKKERRQRRVWGFYRWPILGGGVRVTW
jgi:hypothetical protein